jgi:shikimate kinase
MKDTSHAPVFLIGYRGSGKSTVARLLAERLGFNWVDADDQIEARAGKSIAQIFADEGQRSFRELEAAVAAELCRRQQTVVALGGGAVLAPRRARASSRLARSSGSPGAPVHWPAAWPAIPRPPPAVPA